MNLDMNYYWHIRMNPDNTMIHIENKKDDTLLFDATLRLQKHPLNKQQVSAVLKQFPAMTLSIFKGIYIHALKLFVNVCHLLVIRANKRIKLGDVMEKGIKFD